MSLGGINQTIPFFVSMSSLQFFILSISLFYKYENSMLYKKIVVSALYHPVPEKKNRDYIGIVTRQIKNHFFMLS